MAELHNQCHGEREAVDGNELLQNIAGQIRAPAGRNRVRRWRSLKMTLSPGDEVGDLAVLNVVGNDQSGELSHELSGPMSLGN